MNTLTPIQNTQHIYDLVNLCAEFGVEKAVVCPGSRCAPLLIGFGKHPSIETISITDERSAGFVGLGLAEATKKPVVLVCTSGTAAQNFAQAVTEAFYQQVPLIVLTADRPPEWIDQWDGQTIHQKNLYTDHIKGSFIYDEDHIDVGKKALELAMEGATGPVHLNVPIREPFYPKSLDEISFPTNYTKGTKREFDKINNEVWSEFEAVLNSSEKVMVLGGQMEFNSELVDLLNRLDATIVGDVISNLHGVDGVIQSGDLLFKHLLPTKHTKSTERFRPDLLVTFGRSIICKNLKLFLRKYKPTHHWHIGLGMVGDPFQSLTKIVEMEPVRFFEEWVGEIPTKHTKGTKSNNGYLSQLTQTQKDCYQNYNSILDESEFNYFSAVREVMGQLPENSVLHLGNSMPVRIANFIGIHNPTIEVRCNRGTSGIDGVVSTAVGHSLGSSNRKHTLIIGDLSFFYDRNGLWLNHEFPSNFQIVVLNDSGGGIFNMIPGPSNQDGLTDLFTTPHNRTAEFTAKEFGLDYRSAASLGEIDGWNAGILEIFIDMETNTKTFKRIATKAPRLKENFKKSL
ncbi:MAG: 2-succinyl-5-enolpyruvyl-6-hydroxy-3-cyclohexene-1-carboxylic-acid synthase [Candidatus Marinimicrobia bacterium]|nr:2-succinyl-5-enolpyruvyl-6-hydroxy-3-cyclohexene-1-carboxylic-acid synthase [Candidatus Neomarinimicrobiota bacterium]